MAKRVSTSGDSAPKTTRTRSKKAASTTINPTAVNPLAETAVPEVEPVLPDAVANAMAEPLPVSAPPANPATAAPSNGHAEIATTTDQIAQLAYYFWQERGCPVGSAEEDWFRAERELLRSDVAYA